VDCSRKQTEKTKGFLLQQNNRLCIFGTLSFVVDCEKFDINIKKGLMFKIGDKIDAILFNVQNRRYFCI